MKTSITAAAILILAGMTTGAMAHSPKAGLQEHHAKHAYQHRSDFEAERVHYRRRREPVGYYYCIPRWRIRARLERRGYKRFRILKRRGDVAVLKARRYNGRRYILRVDRCDGRILSAKRLPRRWDRGHRHGYIYDYSWRTDRVGF